MKVIGVIPARYKSSRFEGKPLALINNKPMIIHVAEKVEKALGLENTFVATDDERIRELVISFGYNVVMTSESCLTGTDRLWDFAKQVRADIYINIQGDEPIVNPNDIRKIIEVKKDNIDYIVNGMIPISKDESPNDINIPKVLTNIKGDLIYMSRLPIPGVKGIVENNPTYFKQVCIYGFTYEELEAFGSNEDKSIYESYEDIEILRFFDLNVPIKMVEMENHSIAVDNPEDILKVENYLKEKNEL